MVFSGCVRQNNFPVSYNSSEACFSHSLFDPAKLHQSLSEHISRFFHFQYQSKTLSGTYLCLALISMEGCTFADQKENVKCSSQDPLDEAIWFSSCSDTCTPSQCGHGQCQGKLTSTPSLKSSFWRSTESLCFLSHFHASASAQTSHLYIGKLFCSPS